MENRDIKRSVNLISYVLWLPNDATSWFVSAMLRLYMTDKDRMVLAITALRSLELQRFIAATDRVYDDLWLEANDELF